MVRIRLRRVGLKGQPSYRLVIADQRASRNGGFIENVGFHNPRTQPPTDIVEEERILYWLSVGAQPTGSAANILRRTGTMARYERLKKGESLEALVAEAAAAKAAAAPISPRTSHPSPGAGQSYKKAKEAAAIAADGGDDATEA
jgi:small subunit ribosomal protein S16